MKLNYLMQIVISVLLCAMLNAHVKDGVWQIHKAAYPPIIDGEMDEIYYIASTERIMKLNQDDAAPPDSYLDLFASARLLWDVDYIYVFVKVVDDEISFSSANSYENDSVEYFFDADNSKSFEGVDGVNDMQIRIGYGSDEEPWFDNYPSGSESVVVDWENPDGEAAGYIIETAFPLTGLDIDPDIGSTIGFELQVNDRDNETRENMFRWWGVSNDAWHWAHLWGEATLSGYTAYDVMCVPMASTAPVIDGVLDDVWVDESVAIESGTYVFTNDDIVDGSFAEIEAWEDAQLEFRLMWDSDGFYAWIEVIDDEISVSSANPWENDSIELYYDGDNSKGNIFDGVDDVQYRWVWGEFTETNIGITSEVAWGELDESNGYTCELMIPADNLPFPLEAAREIGWDIQVNDRDNENRENMIRWWSSDNMEWQESWRFGTISLGCYGPPPPPPSAVNETGFEANHFMLAQNFPNPFNPSTTIQYHLPEMSDVRVVVYDVMGHEVEVLDERVKTSGLHHVQFDASHLRNGVYFYSIETDFKIMTRKMLLMK
ncbi:sugar-binding protein [bacterium]